MTNERAPLSLDRKLENNFHLIFQKRIAQKNVQLNNQKDETGWDHWIVEDR